MIIGILSVVLPAVLGLIKLILLFRQPPKPPTPVDDLAEHFDALDRMDKETFLRRRRRQLGDLLSRRMRRDDGTAED